MKTERKAALFLAVCLLICLVPSVGLLAFGPSEAVANERAAQPPALTDAAGAVNTAYLADLADYVAGRFWLRPELISANAWLSARALASSASADVLLGREGWLFYAPTLDDYLGADPMTERELFSAARNLALMQEYCQAQGAAFLFAITPNKSSLYGDYMRFAGTASPRDATRLHALLEARGVSCIDLFSLFAAQDEVLYFAHDSHWNERGAALAADAINAALGRESAYFAADFSQRERHDGDLYEMLYPALTDPETGPAYGGALAFAQEPENARPDSIRIATSSAGEGTLLAFRDSFGNLLYPYLADSFGAALFSRATSYDLTQAAALGADCVLVQLVERNLRYLVAYAPVMPAPLREAVEAREAGAAALSAAASGAPEGHVRLTGALPAAPDADSPVYIRCSGGDYEAFLLADGGFSASVPEGETPLAVLLRLDGEWLAYTV